MQLHFDFIRCNMNFQSANKCDIIFTGVLYLYNMVRMFAHVGCMKHCITIKSCLYLS